MSPRVNRLRRREVILLASTLLATTVFVALSWRAYAHIEMGRKAEMRTALQTVLETTHRAFITWARTERDSTRIWAESPEIVRLTKSLLDTRSTKDALLATSEQAAVRELLHRVQTAKGYEGFFVIAPDGNNLSSSRDENVGVINLLVDQPAVLARLWDGEAILSMPQLSDVPLPDRRGKLQEQRPTMFVGARTDAAFTHGMCPECGVTLHGDLWPDESDAGH